MDLRESFPVFGRHWILTFVTLLLTLLCATGAAIKLPWQYNASVTVALLNSTASSKTTADGNPYLSFNPSLVQTANLISIELGNSQTEALLKSGNYTAGYQAQVLSENPENEEPFIQVSVSGSNANTVEETLHGVTEALKSLLANLQASAAPQDRAEIQVIAEDFQPSRSSSAKIKPLVGLLGIGLVLTFLLPQAADGMTRRRTRAGRDGTGSIKSRPRRRRASADPEGYGQMPPADPVRYRQVAAGRHQNNQPWS